MDSAVEGPASTRRSSGSGWSTSRPLVSGDEHVTCGVPVMVYVSIHNTWHMLFMRERDIYIYNTYIWYMADFE